MYSLYGFHSIYSRFNGFLPTLALFRLPFINQIELLVRSLLDYSRQQCPAPITTTPMPTIPTKRALDDVVVGLALPVTHLQIEVMARQAGVTAIVHGSTIPTTAALAPPEH